jgi:hypothetical protein
MRANASRMLHRDKNGLWDSFPHHNSNPKIEKMNTSRINPIQGFFRKSAIAYSSTIFHGIMQAGKTGFFYVFYV